MSAGILKRLADAARARTVADQKQCRPETLRRIAENRAAREPEKAGAFEAAIRTPGMAFICEVKKASPSRGLIAPEFPYLDIAREYEAAGASAISCLTEPDYFMGQDAYLKAIADTVALPVLRKDFTVDPYMIYQAKALGAAAVLLIAAILDDGQLAEFRALAESLGLSALMEAHTPDEVDRVLKAGATLVGVNNRNLKNFSVDIHTSGSLRARVPEHVAFVAESGITTREDVAALEADNVDAVLIGETLMHSRDKKAMLSKLAGRTQ
ncbi:MAG: indole-3-glycerol phosphate synthase TrpC [Eubacteriaceae bacterium]|nr:indole-3-glycerol phosphate synthase TrpC [Eubacteriaceae bacterium]